MPESIIGEEESIADVFGYEPPEEDDPDAWLKEPVPASGLDPDDFPHVWRKLDTAKAIQMLRHPDRAGIISEPKSDEQILNILGDSSSVRKALEVQTKKEEEELSPRAKANALRFQARAQQDYERRQQEALRASVNSFVGGRVTEEAAELPARAPRFKSPLQVVDDYTARSRDLQGFEAYNALIDARQDLLHSSMLRASPKFKRSYLKGTKANRDKINQAIFDKAREKRGVVLDGFVVAPETREMVSEPSAGLLREKFTQREQVTPARMAPLRDHGTELHFQALIKNEEDWDELDDSQFVEYAEMYADRHPDYKNSEAFRRIAKRAKAIREKMAVASSAKATFDPETGTMTAGIRTGETTLDITNPTWMAIAEARREFGISDPVGEGGDEERSFNDTLRVLYHLEGEDFGTAKVVGLLAGTTSVYGFAYKKLAKHGLTKIFGESAKQKAKSIGALSLMEAGVGYSFNPEGHSIVNMIFNDGEPNLPLSIAEAIAIGHVFNFGFDFVRHIRGKPKVEVIKLLENKLPHGAPELGVVYPTTRALSVIDPAKPPPGWFKKLSTPKPTKQPVREGLVRLNKEIDALDNDIRIQGERINKQISDKRTTAPDEHMLTWQYRRKQNLLDKKTLRLEGLREKRDAMLATPEIKKAMQENVGEALDEALKGRQLRLTGPEERLALPLKTGAERTEDLLNANAVRVGFLRQHAADMRERARQLITLGRKEEGLVIARKAAQIDAERVGMESLDNAPLGSRVARKEQAAVRAALGDVEGGLPVGGARQHPMVPQEQVMPLGKLQTQAEVLQDLVERTVSALAKESKNLSNMDDPIRFLDDILTDGLPRAELQSIADGLEAEGVLPLMRKLVDDLVRETNPKAYSTLPSEAIAKAQKGNLSKILSKGETLQTRNERIAFIKALSEKIGDPSQLVPKAAKAPARAAGKPPSRTVLEAELTVPENATKANMAKQELEINQRLGRIPKDVKYRFDKTHFAEDDLRTAKEIREDLGLAKKMLYAEKYPESFTSNIVRHNGNWLNNKESYTREVATRGGVNKYAQWLVDADLESFQRRATPSPSKLKQTAVPSPKLKTTPEPKFVPIEGGVRVDPHTQMGIAEFAAREMMTTPQVFKELALRSGFGFTTQAAAEDAGYDNSWGAFLFGFSMFNPQFMRIRGRLGIKEPIKAEAKVIDDHVEQIYTRISKHFPTAGTRLMRYEAMEKGEIVRLLKKGDEYFKILDDAAKKGILSPAERKAMSDMLNNEGRSLRMRHVIESQGAKIANSGRGLIQDADELTAAFNKKCAAEDELRQSWIDNGGEIGWVPKYSARAIRADKIKEYNKLTGQTPDKLKSQAIADWEKANGLLGDSRHDRNIKKALRNKAMHDVHRGSSMADPPSHAKQRKMERIDPKLAHLYEGDRAAFALYVERMVHSIEKAKLLGTHLLKIEGPLSPRQQAQLDDTIGGIMERLKKNQRVIPKGTKIQYKAGFTRTLLEDTPHEQAFIGDVRQLAYGEEGRLMKLAKASVDKGFEAKNDEVQRLIQMRFSGPESRQSAWVNAIRALTHMSLIGQFTSTITQGGDMGQTIASESLRSSLKMLGVSSKAKLNEMMALINKAAGGKGMPRPDDLPFSRDGLGLGEGGMEMFEGSSRTSGFDAWLVKGARTTFKYTGFRGFDDIMKNTKLNATLNELRKGVKERVSAGGRVTYEASPKIRERFAEAFGDDFDDLLKAVVKKDWNNYNLKTAVMMELGKLQPITQSNMPAAYMRLGGFGRLCYTVKTFQITYLNNLRRNVASKIGRGFIRATKGELKEGGKEMLDGVTHMGKLMMYFGVLNFGINNVTNFINGRDFDVDDAFWSAFWTTWGGSKFQVYEAKRNIFEGRMEPVAGTIYTVGKTIFPAILTPSDHLAQDLLYMATLPWDEKAFDPAKLKTTKDLPFVGRPLEGRLRDESKGSGRRSRKAPSRGTGGRSAPSRSAPSR